MGLIQSAVLLGIADRAAYQYGLLAANFSSINVTGGGYYWQRVTDTDDTDVEIPLLQTYLDLDQTGFVLESLVRGGVPKLLTVVTQMDVHFSRVGHRNSWDGYLNEAGTRVSDYFNMVYHAAKSQYMLANNVFSEVQNVFATWTNSAGYTAGMDYGTGSWLNRADGTHFAPTQLKAIIDVGSTACTNLILRLAVKDITNSPTTIDTPAITGTAGDSVDIGTTSDRFLAVTNITIVSGNLTGNKIRIENKKERVIAP